MFTAQRSVRECLFTNQPVSQPRVIVVREPNFCSNTEAVDSRNFCSKTDLFELRDVREPRFDCTGTVASTYNEHTVVDMFYLE